MSKIETIVNAELNAKIRVMKDEKGEILFCGKDVATALDYADTEQAIRKNVDKEDISYIQCYIKNDFGTPSNLRGTERPVIMAFINESGLYSLILRSEKKEAKKFKRWVTSEVLPRIRKYGYYARPLRQSFADFIFNKDNDNNKDRLPSAEDIYDVQELANAITNVYKIDYDIALLCATDMLNPKVGCLDTVRNALIERMSGSQTLLAISDEDSKED